MGGQVVKILLLRVQLESFTGGSHRSATVTAEFPADAHFSADHYFKLTDCRQPSQHFPFKQQQ
jgi:hypothetical protein